jgi:hypothetical protein
MRCTPQAVLVLFLSVPILSSLPPPRVPVVVELFTSEGCSDCPPADALLAELDRTQPVPGAQIIPLEEHVDYWNHDGWRDPFSSPQFTERQEEYARRFEISGPYTPQMVVGGRKELVGSASADARAAIAAGARQPQSEVLLNVYIVSANEEPPGTRGRVANSDTLRGVVRVPLQYDHRAEPAEIWLAITEDGLASNVSAGENSGRRLEHRAVVRTLVHIGRVEPDKSFTGDANTPIAHAWKRQDLHVVGFLQGAESGKILGAATSRAAR